FPSRRLGRTVIMHAGTSGAPCVVNGTRTTVTAARLPGPRDLALALAPPPRPHGHAGDGDTAPLQRPRLRVRLAPLGLGLYAQVARLGWSAAGRWATIQVPWPLFPGS